ncbi:MAG: hypothetical protein ACLFN8_00335 [Candidatus Woesearchaeota archaeon]
MKNKNNTITLLILTVFMLILMNLNLTSAQCTGNGPCGQDITTPGYGAVELCSTCYECGEIDGVCPAWYSEGDGSSDDFEVELRVGTTNRLTTDVNHEIIYVNGSDACKYFGGTFKEAQTKSNYDGEWVINSGINDGTNMTGQTDYVRAICENIVQRPSCDECVDVDCQTELIGAAYVTSDSGLQQPIENATIMIYPQNEFLEGNTSFIKNTSSGSNGLYNLTNAYSGKIRFVCSAATFDPVYREVTLRPGKNIIDCPMTRAECQSDCTLPSAQYGERMCSRECDGHNGCEFSSDVDTANILMDACDARPLGFFQELETTTADGIINVTGVTCCNNYPISQIYSQFSVGEDNNVSRLLTRSYNKILQDGTPVFLNIVVYNK